MQNNDNVKSLYPEIIRGRTSFLYNNKICYIKHLNSLDSSDVDIKKQESIEIAKNRGYLTYLEKYNQLIKDKLWTEVKEDQLNEYKDFLDNLKHSKNKTTLSKDKKLYDKDIEKYTGLILELDIEKQRLIGKTAEVFANKKSNDYYILISLYSDSELKNRLYSESDFNDLDAPELEELVKIYNSKMAFFDEKNLKKMSLFPSFFNLYCLCSDNIYNLFCKPFIELSFYQIELISWARQFKNILQNSKSPPPNHLFNDPDKLLEWFNLQTGIEKDMPAEHSEDASKKTIAAGQSLVGMNKSELEAAGFDDSTDKKIKNALKNSKSGELGMAELLKLGL